MAHSQDVYGAEGSVPTVQPTGLNAPQLSVRANPEDFGAQIGAGVQKVGQSAEELTAKYGQMAMETAQNTAEVGFIKDAGDLKAKYMQYEGSQAENMRPQYEAEMQALQAKWGEGLPLAAMHQYNLNTLKSLRYATTDYAGYAASQGKQANMDSGRAQVNIGAWMANDPFVAVNDRRFGEQVLAPIIHGNQVQLDIDHPGLKTDPTTGTVSFDESKPEGKNLKAQYEPNLNNAIGIAYENRFKILASTIGPIAAYNKLQQDKSDIPPASIVRLEASLQPQVMNAHANAGVSAVMTQAAQEHQQVLLNPPLSVRNNNPGNLRDSSTGQFRVFDTPEAGAKAMQDDLTAKISGNSPAMEKNFGKGYSPTLSNLITTYAPAADKNDPKAYIDSVSKETGIAPNQVLTVADIPKLQAAMTKVEAGGASAGGSVMQKPYATNPNGTPLTVADYAATHRQYLFDQSDKLAEKLMPGSLQLKNMMRERTSQQISSAIEDQRSQYNQNNHNIDRAFNGEFTKGKKPTTWAELEAIPGIGDAINFSNERTPEFIKSLDIRLTARANGAGDDHKYGEGYMDMLKGIHPVDGSAPTVTTSNQLYDAYYNGLITDTGREKLEQQLANKKTPEGASEGVMQTQTLKVIKTQVSGADLFPGMKDPKGEELYASALPLVYKAIDDGKAKGIPASELYDPKNKNWVGNAAKGLVRSQSQYYADLAAANMSDENTPNENAPKPINNESAQNLMKEIEGKSTSDAIQSIKDALEDGDITRQQAEQILISKGYARASSAGAPSPQIPKPD